MSLRPPVTAALACALSLAVAGPARAQVGRVGGTITNQKGAPLAGATVTAENPHAMPASLASVANERGEWGVLGLQAGAWTFTAVAPGYRMARVSARVSVLRPNAAVDFTLAPAPEAESRGPLAGVDTQALQAALREAGRLAADGRWQEALAAYLDLQARAPALTTLNLPIGRAQRALGNLDAAVAAFEAVVKADPANTRAKLELGLTRLDHGDTEAATRLFREVVAADPGSPDAAHARTALDRLKT